MSIVHAQPSDPVAQGEALRAIARRRLGEGAATPTPIDRVRAALERDDLDPRGDGARFSARCPSHPDRTPSLSVAEGADGRALVHCHAGCATRDVLDKLGLDWAAVFPASERPARARAPWQAPPRAPVAIVLDAVVAAGRTYRASTTGDLWAVNGCPGCGGDGLWIALDHRGRVRVSCLQGCPAVAVLDALAGVPT